MQVTCFTAWRSRAARRPADEFTSIAAAFRATCKGDQEYLFFYIKEKGMAQLNFPVFRIILGRRRRRPAM